MYKKLIRRAGACLALCFSSFTYAGVIVDTVYQQVELSTAYWESENLDFDSHSYLHNINDQGFTFGSAVSATLEILVSEEPDSFSPDVVLFVIEELDWDSDKASLMLESYSNSLQVEALAALNEDGFLEVTVYSIFGDFFVGDSTLTVYTNNDVATVPEPASLALLGLGLLGLAYSRRTLKS